jgi:hypothetical protein
MLKQRTRHPQACRRLGGGITEIMISTALVGILVVAALNTISMVFRTRRLNADRLAGPTLAQNLMTEILSMPYTDPQNPGGANGVNVGETAGNRSTYDDVDDYHGWSNASAVNRDASARAGYTGWSHSVAVIWINPTTLATSATDTGVKRVTVTVMSPAFVARSLVALKSRVGVLEQTRPLAAPVVSWVGVELRAGASSRSQFAGAPTLNHVPDAN